MHWTVNCYTTKDRAVLRSIDKQWVQDQERWIGHSQHHGKTTPDAEEPCRNF